MSKQYDVIILGAGNAGFAVAGAAHRAGKSVAIVEADDFGGTCPNRGCTPKKVLVAAAQAIDEISRASAHGIAVDAPVLDWNALIDRKNDMISFIPDAMEDLARSRADVYKGTGEFEDPRTIRVGDDRLTAEQIVIATGSTPRPLPFPGAELLMTSDDLLELTELPQSITFIGGGVIALEFSHVFARAGVEVTVLEALPQLLPRMDADAVEVLRQTSEELDIRFETSVSVSSVYREGHRYHVAYEQDGEVQEINADLVVNGTGRVPNFAGLNLDAGEVAYDRGAIDVDASFRSRSNPRVSVVGDALAETPQLSPVATTEGNAVADLIFGDTPAEEKRQHIPQAIYTVPALASVGLTEADALERHSELEVYTSDMSGWFSAKTYAESAAWAKVLIDDATDRIVGAHLVGHRGEELINLFTLAMNHDISATDLKATTFAYPTFSSDIKNLW